MSFMVPCSTLEDEIGITRHDHPSPTVDFVQPYRLPLEQLLHFDQWQGSADLPADIRLHETVCQTTATRPK